MSSRRIRPRSFPRRVLSRLRARLGIVVVFVAVGFICALTLAPWASALVMGGLALIALLAPPRDHAGTARALAARTARARDFPLAPEGLDLSLDAIFALTLRGRILYANQAARLRAGDAHEPLEGRSFAEATRIPEALSALDALARDPRRAPISGEHALDFPHPTRALFHLGVHPAPGRRPPFVVTAIIRDVSRQRQDEAARDDFLADASHQLRTPLAGMTAALDTLMGHAKDDPVMRARLLTAIDDLVRRMTGIVADLLTLSRLRRSSSADAAPTDLVRAARNAIDAMEPRAKAANFTLTLTPPANPADALALTNANELAQLIEILLDNALTHAHQGGRAVIDFPTDPTNTTARLRVRDFSNAADAYQDLNKLTARFHRGADAQTPGSGLGLAIAKSCARRYGGDLTLSHAHPGLAVEARLPRPKKNAASQQ